MRTRVKLLLPSMVVLAAGAAAAVALVGGPLEGQDGCSVYSRPEGLVICTTAFHAEELTDALVVRSTAPVTIHWPDGSGRETGPQPVLQWDDMRLLTHDVGVRVTGGRSYVAVVPGQWFDLGDIKAGDVKAGDSLHVCRAEGGRTSFDLGHIDGAGGTIGFRHVRPC